MAIVGLSVLRGGYPSVGLSSLGGVFLVLTLFKGNNHAGVLNGIETTRRPKKWVCPDVLPNENWRTNWVALKRFPLNIHKAVAHPNEAGFGVLTSWDDSLVNMGVSCWGGTPTKWSLSFWFPLRTRPCGKSLFQTGTTPLLGSNVSIQGPHRPGVRILDRVIQLFLFRRLLNGAQRHKKLSSRAKLAPWPDFTVLGG